MDLTAGVADLTTKAPVDLASHFRVGSITKMFTAAVILQLVADGRIGLDQSVHEVVPGLLADPRITIRMLLAHTANLGDLPTGYDSAALLEHPLRHVDPAQALTAVRGLPTRLGAAGHRAGVQLPRLRRAWRGDLGGGRPSHG